MRTEKLSVNKVCMVACAALFLLSIAMPVTIYFLTQNVLALCCGLLYAVFVAGCMVAFLAFVRRKLTLFSDALCKLLDDMMSADQTPPQYTEEENLFYKIQHRLSRLYEVLRESKSSIAKERADLQELISDISHQVKTPIANLKMLDATLLEQTVTPEKQREFLVAMDSQLDKLDFLMQAMIKTSRLETGVISLQPQPQAIYDTLAAALGGILLNAEQKKIAVTVDCPETVIAAHDRKWTTEALFNILDNAVKYTPEGGKVHVAVVCWEMYVKIDISDTGIGIPEQHQGTIFKRFYRESSVHDAPGIVGTSGSGKSTLLNMIGGLDVPTSGKVIVDGKDLSTLKDEQLTIFRRRKIGFIFQNYNLVPVLNVYENIVLPVELDGDQVDKNYMQEVVRMLGLEDRLNNMPNNLSGGQQQRVAIARALVSKPAIVLADEPTGNLDSRTSSDVLGLLKVSSQKFHQTLVMITHNNEIAQLADRIIRIEDGKISE